MRIWLRRSCAFGACLGLALLSGVVRADPTLDAGIDWLQLLGRGVGQLQSLAAKTSLPFTQWGLKCGRDPATTMSARMALLTCVAATNPLLVESIPAPPDHDSFADWKRLKLNELPRSQRKIARKLASTMTLVGGPLDGNGISYRVALAVNPDGTVAALFVELATNDDQ